MINTTDNKLTNDMIIALKGFFEERDTLNIWDEFINESMFSFSNKKINNEPLFKINLHNANEVKLWFVLNKDRLK